METQLEADLIARASSGDRAAFDALVTPYRARLRSHAYRMLGNVADAEDVVQDTLLRAWKHFGTFEGRSSFGAWLSRIGVRNALTRADASKRRELPGFRDDAPTRGVETGAPSFDVPWLEPLPDGQLDGALDEREGPDAQLTRRQSVALAFLAAVQWLPPLQRSILLLTSVAGWSAEDVAATLETSVAAVNSALQRARATISKQAPGWDQSPPPATESHAALTKKYLEVWNSGDVQRMAALLRDDVRLAMPPFAAWFEGRDGVLGFFATLMPRGPWKATLVDGHNGVPAVLVEPAAGGLPTALHTLTLDAEGRLALAMVFLKLG